MFPPKSWDSDTMFLLVCSLNLSCNLKGAIFCSPNVVVSETDAIIRNYVVDCTPPVTDSRQAAASTCSAKGQPTNIARAGPLMLSTDSYGQRVDITNSYKPHGHASRSLIARSSPFPDSSDPLSICLGPSQNDCTGHLSLGDTIHVKLSFAPDREEQQQVHVR